VLLVGSLVGFAEVHAGAMSKDHVSHALARLMILALTLGAPILGLIATRLTLQNRRGGFRLALLPNPGAQPPDVVQLST
jgi:hypothetical protein